jgi:ribosomal protein S18 acetylase RimI-like enzyme
MVPPLLGRDRTRADPTPDYDRGVEIEPLTPERWPDFLDLFQRRGPRGGGAPIQCSCMWWRERARSGEQNRRAMEALVRGGGEPGLLAYDDGSAIGWISVAPREQYGQLVRSRTYGPVTKEDGVWSIVCFWIDPRARHQGVARALLDAALEHSEARGASAVEAFPHRRRPDYAGSQAMFAAAGFQPVREAGPRTIVRYEPRAG